jgi:hypothetical protein
VNIELVGLPDTDRIWAQVAEDVSRCLRKAPMEIGAGDIWTNCRSGQWLLIIAHDDEKIHGTTVWRFSANRYFECVIMVGNRLKAWFPDLISAASTIAKAHDCRGLVATGRPGLIAPIKQLNPLARVARVTYALEF